MILVIVPSWRNGEAVIGLRRIAISDRCSLCGVGERNLRRLFGQDYWSNSCGHSERYSLLCDAYDALFLENDS